MSVVPRDPLSQVCGRSCALSRRLSGRLRNDNCDLHSRPGNARLGIDVLRGYRLPSFVTCKLALRKTAFINTIRLSVKGHLRTKRPLWANPKWPVRVPWEFISRRVLRAKPSCVQFQIAAHERLLNDDHSQKLRILDKLDASFFGRTCQFCESGKMSELEKHPWERISR